jgi:hypothetical protein
MLARFFFYFKKIKYKHYNIKFQLGNNYSCIVVILGFVN